MKVFDIMDDIYRNNLWNGTESLSGPGSTREYAKSAGAFIETIIDDIQAVSILDAGCGDHNWIGEFIPNGTLYMGLDASKEIIKQNVQNYASVSKWFSVGDYSRQLPGPVDLIICRHSLQHLPAENVKAALNLFKVYGFKLIATTFVNNNDGDCEVGGFYPYNLVGQFGMKSPTYLIREPNTEYEEYLAYWG